MEGNDGDGVVTVNSSILAYANITFIDGACTGVNSLHMDMLDPSLYPVVYGEVKKILEAKT